MSLLKMTALSLAVVSVGAVVVVGTSGHVQTGVMPEVVVVAEMPESSVPEVVVNASVPEHLSGMMPEVVVAADAPEGIRGEMPEVVVRAQAPAWLVTWSRATGVEPVQF